MLVSRILAPVVVPLISPLLPRAQNAAPALAPAPTAAPAPAPVASPTPAPTPQATPAPSASPAPPPQRAAGAPAGPSAPPSPSVYQGVRNDVAPRADRLRVAREEASEAAALSQALGEIRLTPETSSESPDASATGASDAELGILVSRTQADIIADASQALRAQASLDARNVADLLEA